MRKWVMYIFVLLVLIIANALSQPLSLDPYREGDGTDAEPYRWTNAPLGVTSSLGVTGLCGLRFWDGSHWNQGSSPLQVIGSGTPDDPYTLPDTNKGLVCELVTDPAGNVYVVFRDPNTGVWTREPPPVSSGQPSGVLGAPRPAETPAENICKSKPCTEIDEVWIKISAFLKTSHKQLAWDQDADPQWHAFRPERPITLPAPRPISEFDNYDYLDISGEYRDMFLNQQPDLSHIKENIDTVVGAICRNRNKYIKVSEAVFEKEKVVVPWGIIAAIHYRESSLDFEKYLHNGEKVGTVTTIEPVNLQFNSWEEAAEDAIRRYYLQKLKSTEQPNDYLRAVELYNGNGYRIHNSNSPYLWSGSAYYQKGLYTKDGIIDDTKIDPRFGAAVLLKKMADISCITLEKPTGELQIIKGEHLIGKNERSLPQVIEALKQAAIEFYAQTGKEIVVSSAARTINQQALLFYRNCIEDGPKSCSPPTGNPAGGDTDFLKFIGGNYVLQGDLTNKYDNKEDVIDALVAAAGDERHGAHVQGYALDIWCNDGSNKYQHDPICQKTLGEVMINNGFCRLKTEPWHFELTVLSTTGSNFCRATGEATYGKTDQHDPLKDNCTKWDYKNHKCVEP